MPVKQCGGGRKTTTGIERMNISSHAARAGLTILVLALLFVAFRHAGRRPLPVTRPGAVPITWLVPISPAKPMYEELAAQFCREHPEIDLRLIWVPISEYHIKFKTLAAAGEEPDLFDTGDVWVAYMLPFLLDLTPYIARDAAEIDLNDYYPEVLRAIQFEGRYYFLPHNMNVSLLYYNKGLFDKAGLAYPTSEWTWDDLVEAGRRLTLRDGQGVVTQWGCSTVDGWWGEWLIYLRQSGGKVFSDDLRQCLLDSPESIRGMTFFHDKVYRHEISPAPGRDFPNALASGRYGMTVGGHVNDWKTLNEVPGLEWDVQVLPRGPAGRSGGEIALGAYGISKRTAHPEAAWTLLKFLTSRYAGEREVKAGALAVRRSVADAVLFASGRTAAPQNIAAVYEQLKYSEPIPRLPDFIELTLNIVQPEVDLMMQRRQSPEQACRRATEAANAFLRTMGMRKSK